MYIHFAGEPDDGIRPSSQWARVIRERGHEVGFGDAQSWRDRRWGEICRRADVIHLVTYSRRDSALLRKVWLARVCGVPVVRTWIGSDVLWALHHEPSRRMALQLQQLGVGQLAVADHLIAELRGVGIVAEYVPIAAPQMVMDGPLPPLPKTFTILSYLPARRRTFYGGPIVDQLIAEFPHAGFIIVGDQPDRYEGRGHVRVFPHLNDCRACLESSSVLVRPTLHDGMPRMMLEALALGRHVITTHRYPHAGQAVSAADYVRRIEAMMGGLTVNEAGSRFAREVFSPPRAAEALLEKLFLNAKGSMVRRRLSALAQAVPFALSSAALWSREAGRAPTRQDLPLSAGALRAALE